MDANANGWLQVPIKAADEARPGVFATRTTQSGA